MTRTGVIVTCSPLRIPASLMAEPNDAVVVLVGGRFTFTDTDTVGTGIDAWLCAAGAEGQINANVSAMASLPPAMRATTRTPASQPRRWCEILTRASSSVRYGGPCDACTGPVCPADSAGTVAGPRAAFCLRYSSQLRTIFTKKITITTEKPMNSRLMQIVMMAVLSVSISAAPSPHLHSGSRIRNGWLSGTWSGQVALIPAPPVSRMPLALVEQTFPVL